MPKKKGGAQDYTEWTRDDYVIRNRAWATRSGDNWWRWWSKHRQQERGWATQEDFISWAEIGLLRAADKFDPARGVTFLTYATYYIDSEIRNNMRKSAMIRVPYRKQDIRFFDGAPSQQGSRFNENSELNSDGNTFLDSVATAHQPDVIEAIDAKRAFERVLTDREKYVLTMRQHGHTLKHIAAKVGLSRERVRTIAHEAVGKLVAEIL